MARKRYTVEQIIAKLREAEVELARGAKTPEACRKLGITENTYYRRPPAPEAVLLQPAALRSAGSNNPLSAPI